MAQKIYPCGRCFLRPVIADKLKFINNDLINKGYKLKLLDCYRPQSAQQKLWDTKPDKRYVAPPEKGSMHSRGVAVDLTLEYLDGTEVDMGTPYDFFGRKAWPSFTDLDVNIIRHRNLLSSAMKDQGFTQARSEWWHFSISGLGQALDDWEWNCSE